MTYTVKIATKAQKSLKKTPKHIVQKLLFWVNSVESEGLRQIRKIPGWHDEPLRGNRAGQRSVRLSKSWRAIYILDKNEAIKFVEIIEVNNHEY